jgi:hypothetical protein
MLLTKGKFVKGSSTQHPLHEGLRHQKAQHQNQTGAQHNAQARQVELAREWAQHPHRRAFDPGDEQVQRIDRQTDGQKGDQTPEKISVKAFHAGDCDRA